MEGGGKWRVGEEFKKVGQRDVGRNDGRKRKRR